MEKEAAKIETSSSKMNYIPKKFTSSSSSPAVSTSSSQQNGKPNGVKANGHTVNKLNNSNGLLTTVTQTNNSNGSSNANSSVEKCCVCEKTVYVMEKIEADKKVYHKACFKCTSCNCPLK